MSVWQNEEQRCAVVLREVFSWLDGAELARAGAACRAWRRAAAEPVHWRRLLDVPRHSLAALTLHHAPSPVAWRQEYVWGRAGWSLTARHRAPATLLHAALAPCGSLLALAGADASLALWRRRGGAWSECGRTCLRARGWSAVARAQWAGGARLLLSGPLALVHDWELLVLRVEEDGRCGAVASRVRCSAGAAGCWVDAAGDAFLSLELRRLGFGLYCTTVWLNAATQETESEYAGVTSPLLRIYNEDGAHLTHALVAEAPREKCDALPDHDVEGPGAAYLRAIDPDDSLRPPAGTIRLLVAAGGCRLSAWPVSEPRPPPLLASAAGGLAERLRRHHQRRAAPEAEDAAPEPDEASVRAGCTPPAHSCCLHASIVGLVLHERGRCMWSVCSDGSATCVSVSLLVLVRVRAPGGAAAAPTAHYVQPAASPALVAWPAGGYSARVWWCAAKSCARGAGLSLGAAAVCCVLPRCCPPELLVLAGDELYVWRSRATKQLGWCGV